MYIKRYSPGLERSSGEAIIRRGLRRVVVPVMIVLGLVQAHAQAQPLQGATLMPETAHVVCFAEDKTAFSTSQQLADLNGIDELSAVLQVMITGDEKELKPQVRKKYEEAMRKQVWQVEGGFWVRSLGAGFVVSTNQKMVLTSFEVASACPFVPSTSQKLRQQIGVLSPDGLRLFRAKALGINVVNPATDGTQTPLPQYICKDRDSACTRASPTELRKRQLEGTGSADLISMRSLVKFWVPDLSLLVLDEPVPLQPIVFKDSTPPPGASLLFSGFPKTSMIQKSGSFDAIVPAERAKATVQPAVFSRETTIDSGEGTIISADKRVKATWLELTGVLIERGVSGAPLYDRSTGEVYGLVISELAGGPRETSGKAVPSAQILEYLKASKVDGVQIGKLPTPTPTPTPTPKPDPVPNPQHGWLDSLLSPIGLVVAAVVTAGIFALFWLVFRQQKSSPSPKIPEPSIYSRDQTLDPSSTTSRHTLPTRTAEVRAASGPLQGQVFELPTPKDRDTLRVGADAATCNVVFPSEASEISGHHCLFTFDKNSYQLYVEDIRSMNGTFVNKRKLNPDERQLLRDGDVVSLARPGAYDFVVKVQ